MARWVVGSILYGGPIALFLVPPSVPRMVYQRPWYVLSRLWDDAYKIALTANRKEWYIYGGSRFPLSLSEWFFTICLTPYNRK